MTGPAAPTIRVRLDAIERNVRAVCDRAGVPVIAVVKANGYGHGMLPVAQAALAAGASALGVATLDEALSLRAAGVRAPIIAWLCAPSTELARAIDADIQLGLSTPQHLAVLADAVARKPATVPLPVHVKIDTGLGRNGVREDDWPAMFALLRHHVDAGRLILEGMMSHFSGTSAADDAAQLAVFERALAVAAAAGLDPRIRHFAATGAALDLPDARYQSIRLGIGMYGLNPNHPHPASLDLQPALSLSAPLRRRERDGRTEWTVELGEVDGLLPARGLHLTDSTGGQWQLAAVGETHTEVTPLGDRAEQAAGQLAVIGAHTSADDWADAAGTINYEITTRLSPRIPREYDRELAAETDVAAPACPLPQLRIDTAAVAAAVARLASAGTSLDVTADAYGLGVDALRTRVDLTGVHLIVRREHEVTALRARGLDAAYAPDAPPATRAPYGFDGRPATTLRSELAQVKRVPAGHGVSYGYEWRAPHATTLGLVPCGYADAIPRSAAHHAAVAIGAARVPIVGRIAMDQVVVDLGDLDTGPAAPVMIWGADGPTLSEWARWTGLTPAGLLAGVGPRVRREWLP